MRASPVSPPAIDQDPATSFRAAMRELAGGVAVITTGSGAERAGLTATSVSSFSVAPPTILVCINLAASAWPVLRQTGTFGVNLLSAWQQGVAERFAGRGELRGAERFNGAEWMQAEGGAPLLAGALAALDCEVEEAIERHSHAMLLGRVRSVRLDAAAPALMYLRGRFGSLG